MGRHPHRDGIQSGPGQVAHRIAVGHGQNQGQRPRPEGGGQAFGAIVKARDAPGHRQIADVGDQGVEARAALGVVYCRHGPRVGGVCGQAIDGLGRHEDQSAIGQRLGGCGYLRRAVSAIRTVTRAGI